MTTPQNEERLVYPHGPNDCAAGQPVVLLTFDDGPHVEYTRHILDQLKARRARATFFVLGARARAPWAISLLSRMTAEGHAIGSHGFSHKDLTTCQPETIRDEVLRTQDALTPFAAFQPLFRPPYGKMNEVVRSIIVELGYQLVLWNNDPRDWARKHEGNRWVLDAIARVLECDARVIVCHDIFRTTAQHLPELLLRLGGAGYRFSAMAAPSSRVP